LPEAREGDVWEDIALFALAVAEAQRVARLVEGRHFGGGSDQSQRLMIKSGVQ
jgi:hypothetical protein